MYDVPKDKLEDRRKRGREKEMLDIFTRKGKHENIVEILKYTYVQ